MKNLAVIQQRASIDANSTEQRNFSFLYFLACFNDGHPDIKHLYGMANREPSYEKISIQTKDKLRVIGATDHHNDLIPHFREIVKRCIRKTSEGFVLSFNAPDDWALIEKYHNQPAAPHMPQPNIAPAQRPR